jgi:hypothetical protein
MVLPNSEVLFDENLYSEWTAFGVRFNLVDFTGMFITKMDSCRKQKRERDAFDLLIALKSGKIDFSKLTQIRRENSHVNRSLIDLAEFLRSKNQIFDQNVAEFMDPLSESPAELLLEALPKSEPQSRPK